MIWIAILALVAVVIAALSFPAPTVVVIHEPAFRHGYWRDDWAYTRPWGTGGHSWVGPHPHAGHRPGLFHL